MSPHILRLLIDATDALANQYRAQLALLERKERKQDTTGCRRMLRERRQQYERAKQRLEAATMGRAA